METKNLLLTLLDNNRGKYLSGEDLAKTLNVSRAAIWKAVEALRADGYKIDAVKNKGYSLSADTDVMKAQGITKYLMPQCKELDISVYPTLPSTNVTAREMAAAGAPESVVVALSQTGGKGRKGRNFFSPDGSGIYMSILLRPTGYHASKAACLTTMAAVAVCEAIEAVSPKAAQIKWVNDIFIGGKKVCGILTEASIGMESGSLDYAVVGIGINVYEPNSGFPDEIKDIAGSIFERTSQPNLKNRLTAEIINRFFEYYMSQNTAYVHKYRRRSLAIGKEVLVIGYNTEQKAVALDVDDDCHLIVKYPSGKTEALSSGEISIRL